MCGGATAFPHNMARLNLYTCSSVLPTLPWPRLLLIPCNDQRQSVLCILVWKYCKLSWHTLHWSPKCSSAVCTLQLLESDQLDTAICASVKTKWSAHDRQFKLDLCTIPHCWLQLWLCSSKQASGLHYTPLEAIDRQMATHPEQNQDKQWATDILKLVKKETYRYMFFWNEGGT